MKKVVTRILVMIGISLGVSLLYALVHEGGHALLVLLFGGTVTEFQANFFRHTPHVSYIGVSDSMHRALISLGGPVLPLLLIFPITLILRKSKNILLLGTSLLFLLSLLPTLLVSALISLIYGFGAVQATEDVAKFLYFSGLNPFITSGTFLALFIAIVVFLFRVARVRDVAISVWKSLRGSQDARDLGLAGKVIVAVCLVTIGTGIFRNVITSEVPVSQPLSYHTKIDVNLRDIQPASTIFHTFQVLEPATFDFMYSLDTQSEVTLRLLNLKGEPFIFNNQDSIVIYQGSESLPLAYFAGFILLPGNYALEVSPGGLGSLTMYIDSREPTELDLQYMGLLKEVNEGTFSAHSFQKEGYELIYQGEVPVGTDQPLVTVSCGRRKVAAFAVGGGEVSLFYQAEGERHTLLDGFKSTIGRGLPQHEGPGEFWVSVTESPTNLYIYLGDY